jgi:hypothetical protein
VGMPTNRLRDQLKLPHVRRYASQERAAFIDALCAGNPAALKDIRDTSKNAMARVAAVRQAEIMKQDLDNPTRGGGIGQLNAPGLQIVIVQGNGQIERTVGQPMQIEHDPIDRAELEPPQ